MTHNLIFIKEIFRITLILFGILLLCFFTIPYIVLEPWAANLTLLSFGIISIYLSGYMVVFIHVPLMRAFSKNIFTFWRGTLLAYIASITISTTFSFLLVLIVTREHLTKEVLQTLFDLDINFTALWMGTTLFLFGYMSLMTNYVLRTGRTSFKVSKSDISKFLVVLLSLALMIAAAIFLLIHAPLLFFVYLCILVSFAISYMTASAQKSLPSKIKHIIFMILTALVVIFGLFTYRHEFRNSHADSFLLGRLQRVQWKFEDISNVKTAGEWRRWYLSAFKANHKFTDEQIVSSLDRLGLVCNRVASYAIYRVECKGEHRFDEIQIFDDITDPQLIVRMLKSQNKIAKLVGIFSIGNLKTDERKYVISAISAVSMPDGQTSAAAEYILSENACSYCAVRLLILKK